MKQQIEKKACKNCIHYCICSIWSTTDLDIDEAYKYCFGNFKDTADVVPKSEVERLQAEIERLTIDMNAARLGMIAEHERLKTARAEVAREIFAEIEKWLVHEYVPYIRGYSNSLARNFAELKKKYTEATDENRKSRCV